MAELLQNIILSDITLFLIIGLMMVLITTWAFSMREYAGYLLGWMIGFLFILLISAFFVGQEPPSPSAVQYIGPAVFFGLVVTACIGLIVGFVILAFMQATSADEPGVTRAFIVAISTSFTLASGYLMIMAAFSFRLMIAAFVLAVAIGGLFNFIRLRQRARRMVIDDEDIFPGKNGNENALVRPSEPVILTNDLPSPLAQRIQNLRQRARNFGEGQITHDN